MKTYGHRYVLPFCFKNETGKRTTHHLIFVTKHFKGNEVIKEIMAKESSSENQGVPSFDYMPPECLSQGILFELNRPIDELKYLLLNDFSGKSMTMIEIYKSHSVDKPFLSKHYKVALKDFEDNSQVKTSGRNSSKGFADNILCSFS